MLVVYTHLDKQAKTIIVLKRVTFNSMSYLYLLTEILIIKKLWALPSGTLTLIRKVFLEP